MKRAKRRELKGSRKKAREERRKNDRKDRKRMKELREDGQKVRGREKQMTKNRRNNRTQFNFPSDSVLDFESSVS